MSKKAVTIRDIAHAVDMSEATVSLALNGSTLIKEETRKRVRAAADKLGYVPNLYARRLVSGKSGIIGLVVPDIENIYYSSFVRALSDRMAASGFSLSIFISSGSPEKEARAIRDMISSRVEGIVYLPLNRPADLSESRRLLDSAGIPTVCATTNVDKMNCVLCDLEGGMNSLTELILAENPKRVVYLTGKPGVWTLDCRTEAFRAAIGKSDVKSEIIELESVDYSTAFEAAGQFIAEPPDAVICVNDYTALGVVNRLTEAKIKIPKQVSVTGFDDSIFSIASPIPLTTVRQDINELVEKTVGLLTRMIVQESTEREVICIPTTVVRRKTTKNPEKTNKRRPKA